MKPPQTIEYRRRTWDYVGFDGSEWCFVNGNDFLYWNGKKYFIVKGKK